MQKIPFLAFAGKGIGVSGGDVCESNTPKTFCAPHNGFEGRGSHQAPSVSMVLSVALICNCSAI